MVTAEVAAALPTLILVVLAAVWAVVLAITQLRCADAAREAARAAARGEDAAIVREVAEEVAPEGATVKLDSSTDGMLTVEVRARLPIPGPIDGSIPATVRGRAVALLESR
jgi:Flp pilus assembly protein TadG